MKFSSLGSGSSGNSSYIEMGNKKFLVDAGFSGKKIAEKLNNIEKRIEDITGIFVTHEHSDHIQGLGVVSRKYDIPIYLHEMTYGVIREKIGKIDKKNLNFIREDKIIIGNCVINNFETFYGSEKIYEIPESIKDDREQSNRIVTKKDKKGGWVYDEVKGTISPNI